MTGISSQNTQLLTRRSLLGSCLVIAIAAGFTRSASPTRNDSGRAAPSLDALLIDKDIALSHELDRLFQTSARGAPVVRFQLDAWAQAGLRRVLNNSQAIMGISSGAALFCLERMAWDCGFRLTGRLELNAANQGDGPSQTELAGLLGDHSLRAVAPRSDVRSYRPSRLDGTLHVWVMQKSSSLPVIEGSKDALR